ncbi:MAG: copper resistance protein CopZ [Clostridiales bacterium GWB2_37_7]|nr:MAG: copper resistance protein CopZ [Clostridiales bacterium GWB2_37_7]
MKEHTVKLKQVDMLCHKCILNVLKALSKIDGISELDVSLEEKRVKITYNNEKLSRQKIQAIVNESITKGKVSEELFH